MTQRQVESNANNALGNRLRPMLGQAVVRVQNSGVIVGQPLLQPDALITSVGRSPVVVEAEYTPAANVEEDARGRLGLEVIDDRRRIEAALALRYPEAVRTATDQESALRAARLDYCLFTPANYGPAPERKIKGIARFPESGWLEGSLADLADLIRLMSLPQLAVDTAADLLQEGIALVAAALEEMERERPFINPEIARLLGMDNVPQTRRMAGAILANAMVFHERIAGMHAHIKTPAQVCGAGVTNPRGDTLATWAAILEINYWPIFDIARRILSELPAYYAAVILRGLEYTSGRVAAVGVENAHDLTGRVFQRLIADRKYLATFYTRPESAALLARLAVARLPGGDWSDAAALSRLRIADFACGTGALLSAVYEQITARHERAGGDPVALHPAMMEEVLYGCDVMPSAVHITSATLSGAQPQVGFGQSRLYTMPYGRLSDGSVAVGSLEFLAADAQITLSNFSDPAARANGNGDEQTAQAVAEVPDGGFDLVIMNPPFPSNTKHFDAAAGVVNAAFAAFDLSEADQAGMAERMKHLARDTVYHGHAGLGSAFVSLAERKLKPGGIVALVLPFTAVNGASWVKFRELLAGHFDDIALVSIAANGRDMSFSSDTGMAECLVLGRKLGPEESSKGRGNFISLRERPANFAAASEVAKSLLTANGGNWQLEEGPFGGALARCGDTIMGEAIDAPVDRSARGWGVARIRDAAVAQTAYALSAGQLWLPGQGTPLALPMAPLGEVGQLGVHDSLLTMPTHKGPFRKERPEPTATYPSLCNHDAKRETRMICEPDSQMRVRRGMQSRAAELWATASRAHINRDFTFGSQALAVAFTERDTLGGREWPNIGFEQRPFDYAFAIWGNSVLGLLAYWWQSSRQQSSKASMTRLMMPLLPILDLRALTDDQLTTAQEIFEEFRDKELQPAYLADADPNRALLDQRVICDLLGFDAAVYQGVRRLAEKWCAEPSVHGGKARPKNARLVV